jgi:hypothetical protein
MTASKRGKTRKALLGVVGLLLGVGVVVVVKDGTRLGRWWRSKRAAAQVAEGEAVQPGTTLIWQKCAPGQLVEGHGCGAGVTWERAKARCAPRYRLATEAELRALLRSGSCVKDDACKAIFGKDDGIYWSSTLAERGEVRVAWFFNADVTSSAPTSLELVRCVRDAD